MYPCRFRSPRRKRHCYLATPAPGPAPGDHGRAPPSQCPSGYRGTEVPAVTADMGRLVRAEARHRRMLWVGRVNSGRAASKR